MRIDSGNSHFGLATGPVVRAPVDFTSGSMACWRASFALIPDNFFDWVFFGGFSFRTAGIVQEHIASELISARIKFESRCVIRDTRYGIRRDISHRGARIRHRGAQLLDGITQVMSIPPVRRRLIFSSPPRALARYRIMWRPRPFWRFRTTKPLPSSSTLTQIWV